MKRWHPRLLWRSVRRSRRSWPLSQQLALAFAALMMANGLIISTTLEYWSEYKVKETLQSMSPEARRAWRTIEAGNSALTGAEMQRLASEFEPLKVRLDDEISKALYILIAMAAVITMICGYFMLGRIGRGLGNVATAARQITTGDLTARAQPVGFASLEEDQLASDFNAMAAALQRAERELAESTASIAHELRTPLTILRGRLHGMIDGVFDLEPSEVEGLLYQVEGLGRLVDDLQTLSLARSERLILTLAATDLAEEVGRVLAITTPDLIAAGLEPLLNLSPTPVVADGVRIRQAVSAVLANARRYAALSGPLRINTSVAGDEVVLDILDQGPGLPKDEDGRAFERFWRSDASRNRDTGGSGLGLSVVRAIVEAHGGTATLCNHAASGAAFQMRLPQALNRDH